MPSSPRRVPVQRQEIEQFVMQTVGMILEELEDGQQQQNSTARLTEVSAGLTTLLAPLEDRYDFNSAEAVSRFVAEHWPMIIEASQCDSERYPLLDPAMSNADEVFCASNGFWATIAYRVAHALKALKVPVVPRAISAFAHSRTGIDIHPSATIAPGLFIDHGTGIAIGCTAVVGRNVNLYNGVVLGTSSKPTRKTAEQSEEVLKRHPTVKDGVSLYTNAFVGGDVIVGENAVIGAYAFVCREIKPGEVVLGRNSNPADAARQLTTSQHGDIPAFSASPKGVLQLIGNTPMVKLTNSHNNPDVRIFAKLEGANPSGSVKDRIALSLIEQGEKSGELTHDKIILESTSGNTGIGLAMVGAAKGYRVVLTMSAAMSEERKKVLRAFGATLVETDPKKGTGGAIDVARQMFQDNPGVYWMSGQHSSPNNPLAHYENTATEILRQVPDVTHFVAGIGTFGTLRGAGVRLREEVGAKVVGVEPVLGQAIQGLRNMNEPNSPSLYDESLLDLKLMAMADSAYEYTRQLAERDGLLVGMSSGAAMDAATRLARMLDRGTIVVLFPDRGEKYLSTSLFDAPARSSATAASAASDELALSYHI